MNVFPPVMREPRVVAAVCAVVSAVVAALLLGGGGLHSTFGHLTVPLLLAGAAGIGDWCLRPWRRCVSVVAPAVLTAGFLSRALSLLLAMTDDPWHRAQLTQIVGAIVWALTAYLWLVVWHRVLLPYSAHSAARRRRNRKDTGAR